MIYSTLFKIIENEKKYDKLFEICHSLSEIEICSICLEECDNESMYTSCIPIIIKREVNVVKLIKCGHIFHEKCIRKLLEINRSHINCPLCRELYIIL